MAVVSAVAFAAALLCFYSGARVLRTRRAIEQLGRRDAGGRDDRFAGVGSGDDSPRRPETADPTAASGSVERGFVLLTLGAFCAVLGVFAL